MSEFNQIKAFFYSLLDYDGVVENAKLDKHNAVLIFFIGTIIIMALCIGIMYLRFRIFGG